VTIEDRVDFLGSAEAYPEGTKKVEVTETHMSWVFLTDTHAYKLKKPVKYGIVDYRSLAARRLNCRREVRLNRRLAPDVYLGTVALRLDAGGDLHLGGQGRAVDWLVKMRRLPARCTLDHAIRTHTLQPKDIDAVATRLSRFYLEAPQSAVDPRRYCRTLETQIAASGRQLTRPAFGLNGKAIRELADAQLDFLSRGQDLFAARARSGKIVEGHGDLRPEHIYLCDSPIIVDCLEFDRDLRTLDPASELAYLAMECERLGAGFVESRLFDTYRRQSQDDPPRLLIIAYKCFHAYLRAKIAISHLDDAAVRQPLKWKRRTEQYLGLAQKHVDALGRRQAADAVPLRR
jgi:aminoglycoside phosphotransferase family enzyme